jgi:hypothetical protein
LMQPRQHIVSPLVIGIDSQRLFQLNDCVFVEMSPLGLQREFAKVGIVRGGGRYAITCEKVAGLAAPGSGFYREVREICITGTPNE